MKIAYVIGPSVFSSTNGIKSQAITWADMLRIAGHDITLVDNWSTYKWKDFDIVHFFGSGGTWFSELAKILYPVNQNLVWSPICDEISNPYLQRFKTFLSIPSIQIFSPPFIRRKSYRFFKGVFVRSEYESNFLQKAYGVDSEKINKVPITTSYNNEKDVSEKETFCFHLSSFTQQRKNVARLIEAAKKYEFNWSLQETLVIG